MAGHAGTIRKLGMAELLSSRSHPKRQLALRSEDVVRAYKRLSRVERAFLDLHEPAPVTSYFTVLLVVFVTALLELGIVRWVRRGAARGRLASFDLPGLATGPEQP